MPPPFKVGVFISIPKCPTKTILNIHKLGINRNHDANDKNNNFIIYVGKIENFENDNKIIIDNLNNIFIQHNIKKQIEYININKNSSFSNDEITPENKELIYNMFRKDFDYFGYSK